jgi:nitrate reductase NapD
VQVNYSGILVIVPPSELESTVARLEELPGVEVHHRDPDTGRLIVVQEASTVGAEVDGLKQIKNLPHIVLAEMVEHHFEEDEEIINSIPDGLEDGLPEVPEFLQD